MKIKVPLCSKRRLTFCKNLCFHLARSVSKIKLKITEFYYFLDEKSWKSGDQISKVIISNYQTENRCITSLVLYQLMHHYYYWIKELVQGLKTWPDRKESKNMTSILNLFFRLLAYILVVGDLCFVRNCLWTGQQNDSKCDKCVPKVSN